MLKFSTRLVPHRNALPAPGIGGLVVSKRERSSARQQIQEDAVDIASCSRERTRPHAASRVKGTKASSEHVRGDVIPQCRTINLELQRQLGRGLVCPVPPAIFTDLERQPGKILRARQS